DAEVVEAHGSFLSEAASGESTVEAGRDAAGVRFEDLLALLGGEGRGGIDVALRVIEVVTGARVDVAYGADHLAGEEDVADGDHVGQQVDPWLVVDARVEEHVVEQVLFEVGTAERHREAPEAPPVV